jgi:D-alanyl-lipoteichoic acid acyltransferase DltB (MBOAT superfamily)
LLFNSGEFFVLLGTALLLYAVLGRRGQNRMLLVASWVFYAWWDWRFLALLWLSTVVDFAAGQRIEAARARDDAGAARRWLGASLTVNLGALGFFKYWNFFADSAARVLEAFGLHASPLTLDVILPVGISFYTFQTLSYTVDVYRGTVRAERDPLDFALFVAFFPQLMAGPIERASQLLPQLKAPRRVYATDWGEGGWLVFWGLFKKVFIADNLAPYTWWGYHAATDLTTADVWLVQFAFVIQLYCDFSGYSDMARGMARLFGVSIENNFHLPYFSSSPTDLWRRWHRTLAFWFRDYVYGPITRAWPGTVGRGAAALATMGLVGLWHGAAWHYVIWGLLWGLMIILHRTTRGPLDRAFSARPRLAACQAPLGAAFVFYLWLAIGFLFFAPDLARAGHLLRLSHDGWEAHDRTLRDAVTVAWYSAPLVVMQIAQLRTGELDLVPRLPAAARFAICATLAVLLLVMGAESDQEFFYFAF